MDFKEVAERLKQKREQEAVQAAAAPARPVDPLESFRIRAKMIGLLLRDARLAARRSLEDCALKLGVEPELVEQWELGDVSPSLPQLEILAYYLDIPVSHFWGTTTRQAAQVEATAAQSQYIALRDRMIGVLLRQARLDRGLTLADLAAQTNIPAEQIDAYELGDLPVPMHELTVLAGAVQRNLPYFLETSSTLGDLLATREAWKHFSAMPEDLRAFAANPLNVGFIELAQMFSQMPADKLRRMAESILNITL